MVTYGCYEIHEMGGQPDIPTLCFEMWDNKEGKKSLMRVQCENFYFQPNGVFHASEWKSATLDPRATYSDSMTITVGRCSVIE